PTHGPARARQGARRRHGHADREEQRAHLRVDGARRRAGCAGGLLMPRDLEPQIVAPPAAALERGMLLVIPGLHAENRAYKAMRFQYNPESVSRTRQGEWASDRVRATRELLPRQDRSLLDGHRGGGLYAKSEVVSFKLTFDASEVALRDDAGVG